MRERECVRLDDGLLEALGDGVDHARAQPLLPALRHQRHPEVGGEVGGDAAALRDELARRAAHKGAHHDRAGLLDAEDVLERRALAHRAHDKFQHGLHDLPLVVRVEVRQGQRLVGARHQPRQQLLGDRLGKAVAVVLVLAQAQIGRRQQDLDGREHRPHGVSEDLRLLLFVEVLEAHDGVQQAHDLLHLVVLQHAAPELVGSAEAAPLRGRGRGWSCHCRASAARAGARLVLFRGRPTQALRRRSLPLPLDRCRCQRRDGEEASARKQSARRERSYQHRKVLE